MCIGFIRQLIGKKPLKSSLERVFWLLLSNCGDGPFQVMQSDLDTFVEISKFSLKIQIDFVIQMDWTICHRLKVLIQTVFMSNLADLVP